MAFGVGRVAEAMFDVRDGIEEFAIKTDKDDNLSSLRMAEMILPLVVSDIGLTVFGGILKGVELGLHGVRLPLKGLEGAFHGIINMLMPSKQEKP